MTRLKSKKRWHPNPTQELLLKSALLSGQPMRQAFAEWIASVTLDDLDYASYRLLPLLYHNLKNECIKHPLSAELQKSYMETWAKNQILFRKTAPILKSLHEAGILTLVLKGASLTINYYKDFGLRPMSDFDLLIPPNQIEKAIGLLKQLGWIPRLKTPAKSLSTFLSVHHAINFINPEAYPLDLHIHALKVSLGSDADTDFWQGAIPFEIENVQTLCLNPTDELFHTCIHGAEWNPMPPIRWVADAVTIQNSGVEIDWNRIIFLAKKHHMVLKLTDTFKYLIDRFGTPIPPDLFTDLKAIYISKQELKEYQILNRFPLLSFYMPTVAYYPRIAKDTGRPPGIFGYLKYWQTVMELKHIWQAPLSFIWIMVKKLLGLQSE